MYYFYLFRCADGTLYCGSTNDITKREQLHNSGKGAKYTRSRGGGVIVYSETHPTRSAALRREAQVKKWRRAKKLGLVKGS
jgi:putative endonuclease